MVLNLKNSSSQKPDKTNISGKSSEIKNVCAQWDRLHICDGVLYCEWIPENPSDRKLLQYVFPKNMRSEIFKQLHASNTTGHMGCSRKGNALCRSRYLYCSTL